MPNETYYSLQIIRVENILRKSKKSALFIEIKFDKVVRKIGYIDGEGKPERNDTLTFSRSNIGSNAFAIQLKSSSALIGETTVGAEELPQGLTGKDLHRNLHTEKRCLLGGRRLKRVGSIVFRLKSVDAETRAEIEVNAAEQSVKHIEDLVLRIEDRDEAIGTFISVADGIIAIVDDIAKIHPIFNVSWKAVLALYKLIHRQLQNDAELIEMVEEMRTAFEFSEEANKLNDSTKRLKPVVKKLLGETADCSRFVQEYAKHNFPRRVGQIDSTSKIKEYSKEFSRLRNDLDTAIGMNTNKDVQDIKLLQKLDALLLPVKSDPSVMSDRPRCVEDTRQGYLNLIMEFLSDTASLNILWLTGAAGSGKSTIAVTTSDLSGKNGRPPTYMFFERGKSDPNSVIRTISYTLASLHPAIAQHIQKALETNPTICGTTLKSQFEELLRKPLDAVAADIAGPVVIILDALDECGTAGDRGRADLLHLLKDHFTKLPSKVRILITSRPEPDMNHFPAGIKHVELEADLGGVSRYIREELGKDITDYNQECDNDIQELCNTASGLFIWASTAIKMIRHPLDARENLRELAKNIRCRGVDGMDRLDGLYATVLEGSGIWSSRLGHQGTAVLGLVLFAKEAMTEDVIADILGLDKRTVARILERLLSVVSYASGKPVRLHHASFADYLSRKSEDKSWHINEAKEKRVITERCFDVMNGLRFNICNIETSYLPNSEIPGLNERIKENISPQLSYACRFWSAHMCELERPGSLDQVPKGLKSFMEDKLLYWLEVLSLTGVFNRVAGLALREASSWASLADKEISSFLWSAYNLMAVFSLPISQSVPHIYLSAISLWKDESPIAARYSRMHPIIDVCTIGMKVPSPCIKVLSAASEVLSVAVSNDGRRIASSSENRAIRIWDTDSGEALWSNLEMDDCDAVAFSPNGEHLVSCSRQGTVCTWDVGNGKLISTFYTAVVDLSDRDRIETLGTCSSDGKRVVSICNKTVSIFNVDDGNLRLVPVSFKDDADVQFRAISTNGKYVAGTKNGMIAIWDSGTGGQIFEADIDMPNPIAVSSDGKRVVAVSRDGICILSVDSGDRVVKKPMRYVSCAAFSWDGKRIVVGFILREITILDANNGDVIWGPVEGHTIWVTSVTFHPDGKRVISGSGDRTIRIWDVSGGKVSSGSFDAHTRPVCSVAFSPDGKRIVSGSNDRTVRIWDGETGKLVAGPFYVHDDCVYSVAFSPDGKRVVSGSADSTIRIWDVDSGRLTLAPIEAHKRSVLSVAFSTDGKRIASGSDDKTIIVWDASSGELVKGPFEGHTDAVHSVSFSPDGKNVVSGSSDSTVCIWDVDTGELRHRLEGHSGTVLSVTFSPTGKHVASGSRDKTIRIWDAGSGELLLRPFEGHTSGIFSVSYSPDGEYIVSGSYDKTVCIWNAESGELILGPLEGHTAWVRSVSFSLDGQRVVSGSEDKTIRVWDVCTDSIVSGRDGVHAGDSEASNLSSVMDCRGQPDDSDACRTFSNWKLNDDGWVKGDCGELLVWIPEDRRTTLWTPRTKAVLSCEFSTRIDFSRSPIGENWTRGYPLPR